MHFTDHYTYLMNSLVFRTNLKLKITPQQEHLKALKRIGVVGVIGDDIADDVGGVLRGSMREGSGERTRMW